MFEKLGDWIFGYLSPAAVVVITLLLVITQNALPTSILGWVVFAGLVSFMLWIVGICWYFTWQWGKAIKNSHL